MASALPQAASKAERRRHIVEAAAHLFAERGFGGVSINDIGAALGTSGPALYKHFASKDALLAEMLIGISQRLLDEGQRRAAASAEAGPRVVLDSLISWHVEFALRDPALITVQFRDLDSLTEADQHAVRRLQRAYVELWVEAICAVIETTPAHARSAAHAVFGLINSTPHSARLSRTDMAAQLCRMASAALLASGSDTP